MKTKHLLLITTLILTSCNSNKKSPSSPILIHPSNLDVSTLPLEDLIEVEKIITLETNPDALIGGIWGFAQSENGILIRNKGNRNLFIYNENGSFKTKIEHVGKGPGEYSEIFGSDWIMGKREIVISDGYGKKLLFFSIDGKFLSETNVQWMIHNVASVSPNNFALHLGRFSQMGIADKGGNGLIVVSKEGELVEKYFPFSSPVMYELGTGFSQGLSGPGRSYYKMLDANIYQINPDLSLDTIWRFDFGSFNPDTSQLLRPGAEGVKKLNELEKTNPFFDITSMCQTSNTLMITIYHNRIRFNIYLNNLTHNKIILVTDSLGSTGTWNSLPIHSPEWTYNESFIYELSAIDWLETINGLDEKSKTKLRKTIPGFEKAEQISVEDNPILIYYKVKDF